MKPAEVRFYFDEDILGLGRVIAAIRNDCTYPGDPGAKIHKRERPACPIAPATKDTEWLPKVAARGGSSSAEITTSERTPLSVELSEKLAPAWWRCPEGTPLGTGHS